MLPKLLQDNKKVDHPTDGAYQGQSNSIAITTCAKGNRGIAATHQELCDGYGGRQDGASHLGPERAKITMPPAKITDVTEKSNEGETLSTD